MASSSSSSALTVDNECGPGDSEASELPTIERVLDMKAGESELWCNQLGLGMPSTKKARQALLIRHITTSHKPPAADNNKFSTLKADISTEFSHEWALSKEELRTCDLTKKGKSVVSKEMTDSNGLKWRIALYPKGDSGDSGHVAVYLRLDNEQFERKHLQRVLANANVVHTESGNEAIMNKVKFTATSSGLGLDLMPQPSVSESECSICLDRVMEKLSSECGHAFCTKCTLKLVVGNPTVRCPLCRASMTQTDEFSSVRYAALDSFTLKVSIRTLAIDRDLDAPATLRDVASMTDSFKNCIEQTKKEILCAIGAVDKESESDQTDVKSPKTKSRRKRSFSKMTSAK